MLLILYHLFSRQTCLPPFILSLYVSYFHTHPKTPSPKNFSPAFPCPLIFSFKKSISGDEGYRSPCPSHAKRMLYHLSYIPIQLFYLDFHNFPLLLILFRKNASGGVRTHASLDSRSWDGPLRPLGHECFSILLFYPDSRVHYSPSFLWKMHPVGFEPTHLSIAELKSAPLDHSGTNASCYIWSTF